MNSFNEKNIQLHYNQFAGIYNTLPSDEFFQRILGLGLDEKSEVLDIGCASGKLVFQIAEKFNCEKIVGIDISEVEIEIANKTRNEKGLTNCSFYTGNALNLPFEDAEFDFVISNRVFQLINEMEAAFKEADRVLKPGGQLFILLVTSDKDDVMPEYHDLLKTAWKNNITDKPAPKIFNVVSVKDVENMMANVGVENYKITLERYSFKSPRERAEAGLPVYNILGGYWKQGIDPEIVRKIDNEMKELLNEQCDKFGYFKSTGHFLILTYKK
ncbi:MAG: class I SAM-dependent methyltransferase [Ignavibacteriales bacterium]|nr:MAG: class I SAM-dependent methyltransferase [Ignavibacteriales bacterium]